MAQEAQPTPVSIRYGHTTDTVVVLFSQPLQQLGLKPHEVDAMIVQLQAMKGQLAMAQAVGQNRGKPA
jgi:hypothetical protein